MKIGMQNSHKQKKIFLIPVAVSAFVLAAAGVIGLSGQIWADRADMTRLQFSDALFCQRVSQAVNDSLGDGMADGSDCVNRNLYVSTAELGNIQTLNIVPPEDGFGSIDWETQSINIGGTWTTAFYNLTSLSITNMHVQSISALSSLRGRLTYLDLSGNRISDVSPLLTLRETLTYLNLSKNPISEGLRSIGEFTALTTLNLSSTDVVNYEELFMPADVEIEYDEETGEPLTEPETSSNLAKVLQVFDISNNESMSGEKEENYGSCDGGLTSFESYAQDLAITELYAYNNNLNSDDLICISALQHLGKLDVSNNHIDDFSSIKSKTFTSLAVDSQSFVRAVESLDYSPLPAIFTQAQEEDYFEGAVTAPNDSVMQDDLTLVNAQFNGDKIRFVNAAIASAGGPNPQPATVMVPAGTGAFENSKLEIYFTGQVVTFNDTNLCSEIYRQGENGIAFYDIDWNTSWAPENPIVLTNACDTTKQIALVSGGSYQFYRLELDGINDGEIVDLKGLEEFTGLQVLSLQNNGLTDITALRDMYQLMQLWLNDNNLGSDAWEVITDYLTSLNVLYLNNNHMSEISSSMANLEDLGSLYLVNNGIRDVSPLADATSLTVLDLSENALITDFSGMAQEESACNPSILKLENAGVTRIPDASVIAAGFSNLTSLNLNGNQITDETIANLASASRLDELYLNNNRLTSTAGFSGITKLKKLFLDNNQIADVSGLTSLTKLAELHMNSNQVDDIAGLETLPLLATIDIKNQTLTDTLDTEGPYILPAVFTQAKTMSLPNVSGFQSAGNYTIVNGTIDYDAMTVTITDTSEAMVVTIPDGGLAGTNLTVTHGNGGNDEEELSSIITDRTNGGATVEVISANSFTVTSDKACMVLWTQDNGTSWTRLSSSAVEGNSHARTFSISPTEGMQIVVAYIGDANSDSNVNVRDARKIVNTIIGRDTLSSLEEKLADVDGRNGVNVRDARAIINNIMGAEINW